MYGGLVLDLCSVKGGRHVGVSFLYCSSEHSVFCLTVMAIGTVVVYLSLTFVRVTLCIYAPPSVGCSLYLIRRGIQKEQ